jgi:hypothetical protein
MMKGSTLGCHLDIVAHGRFKSTSPVEFRLGAVSDEILYELTTASRTCLVLGKGIVDHHAMTFSSAQPFRTGSVIDQ